MIPHGATDAYTRSYPGEITGTPREMFAGQFAVQWLQESPQTRRYRCVDVHTVCSEEVFSQSSRRSKRASTLIPNLKS